MQQLPPVLRLTISAVLAAAAAAQAQPASQADVQRSQNFMSMWNPQVMIDQSVRQAVRRYSLNSDQEQIARKMTTDGVNAFLDKHEEEVRSLVRDAIAARMARTPPTPEQVQEWTRRAMPLFEEAQKEILNGNQKFRDVLSDEQKKTFDSDQRILRQQLVSTRERLDRWAEGKFNPDTDWLTPRPRPTTRPARPTQEDLDRWDLYVRGFISRYKLDAPQTRQAMAILSDSRNRATEYWFSRKAEIEAAGQRVKELQGDPARQDQAAAARKQLDDLNRPIDQLYAEMQERLNAIPTDDQRKAYEAEAQARRDRWRDRIRRTGGDTALSATSQSQPTASQLAEETGRAAGSRPAVSGPVTTRPVRIRGPVATRPAGNAPTATRPAGPGPVADAPH